MKSIFNKNNIQRMPFFVLSILIFVYICPNIRYPSIGENSLFPAFISVLGYSFFSYKELNIYLFVSILSMIFPIYSVLFSPKFGEYSIISSLMSLYLLTVPVLSSITLGRILGYRYSYKNDRTIRREFYLLTFLLGLLFGLSAFLKNVAPSILYFFLHAGRTSHNRLAFFFTEPSQSSSVLIGILLLGFCFLFKNNFSVIFQSKRKIIGFCFICFSVFLIYLAQPLSIFAQLAISAFLFVFILISHFVYQIIRNQIIKLRILGLKKSILFFGRIFIFFAPLISIVYFTVANYFERMLGLLKFIEKEGLFLGVMISAGNRFYYIFTTIIEGLRKPLSIPGDWVGNFSDSLLNVLSEFKIMPPDSYGLLQLYKQSLNPLLLKPSGWLYFGIYDLGIIGLLIISFFLFKKYLFWSINGIIKCDKFVVLLVSIQLSLLLMPLLPSTPSAFLPLLVASMMNSYLENKKIINNNFDR